MVIEEEIIICEEIEKMSESSKRKNIEYFVICKKGSHRIGGCDAYDCLIAGEKCFSWVVRACENAKVLDLYDYQNELEAVAQNLGNSDYVVILNGNLPLLTKNCVKNVVEYFLHQGMNALRLKGGYIFNASYLREVNDIFSSDCFNVKTNDFFEIENFNSLLFARKEIEKRILNYHSKNGVTFNGESFSIDANAEIMNGSTICDGVKILSSSKIHNCYIGFNSLVEDSSIHENSKIEDNVFIKNCEIGSNVKIASGVMLENCTIGDNVEILAGSRILNSEIASGVKIGKICDIVSSKVCAGAKIGSLARLLNFEIEENYELFEGKIKINKSEEK